MGNEEVKRFPIYTSLLMFGHRQTGTMVLQINTVATLVIFGNRYSNELFSELLNSSNKAIGGDYLNEDLLLIHIQMRHVG